VSLLLFLATLPSLYWAQPVETASAVRQAGIEQLCVPPEAAAAWQGAGFTAVPFGEKDRRARYRSAVELHDDLRACRARLAAASRAAGAAVAAPQTARGLRGLLRRIFKTG